MTAIRMILKEEGWVGVYKGLGSVVSRDVHHVYLRPPAWR